MPPRRGGGGGGPPQCGRGQPEGDGGGDGYGGRGRGGGRRGGGGRQGDGGRGHPPQEEGPYHNPQWEGGRGAVEGRGGAGGYYHQQGERGRGGYRGGGGGGGYHQQERREGGGGGGYPPQQQGGYRGGGDGGDRGGRGGGRGDRGGYAERGGRGRGDDYGGRRGGGGGRGGGRGYGGGHGAENLASSMAVLNVNDQPPITYQGPDHKNHPNAKPVLSSMSIGKENTLVPPSRSGFGTAGKQVLVRANHFLVGLSEGCVLCQYDVDITPRVTSKGVARSVMRLLIESNLQEFGGRFPVYDGSKGLYIAGPPLFERKDFEVNPSSDAGGNRAAKDPMSEGVSGRQKVYKVSIRNVALLNQQALDRFLQGKEISVPHEFLQALDITMRESPVQRLVPSGRSFYDKSYGTRSIDGGLVAWNGFYQSLRPTMQGLVLNIDLSTTAFTANIPVLDYLAKKFGFRIREDMHLSDADRHRVKKALVRLKVQVIHRQTHRKYRIAGLSDRPTGELQFTASDGQEIRVMDYFFNTYQFRVQFPGLPCLMAQGNKVNYLPMEACVICEGQKYGGRLTQKQTKDIQMLACQRPHIREGTILGIMDAAEGPGRGQHCQDFGIQISTQLTGIRARLLPAPSLQYKGQGKSVELVPRNGQWNLREQQVVEGAAINFWGVICFDERMGPSHGAEAFVGMLAKRCRDMGINLRNTTVVPPMYCSWRELEQSVELERVLRDLNDKALLQIRRNGGRNLQLLVCIFPDKHVAYGDLKRICETEIGIVTQCCLSRHLSSYDSQYLANLGLKINAKMGGRNVILSNPLPQFCRRVFSRPTMFFGIDVSHPPSGDDSAPSIAAVVGSMDWPTASKYIARVRSQGHRTEILDCTCFKQMIKELWLAYQASMRVIPERIIVFRDGVSEGQFDSVLQNEVVALKEILAELGPEKYAPLVTWTVVQKRHHTRLFPADNNVSSSGNVPAGTVVDSTITHPREFDFYLCSHHGIQGTSRPTHYHVLWDENGFYPDEFQGLIYNLCHTYARATKAVSIVPPAYYAHLAAFRARLYLDSAGSGSDTTSIRGGDATASARSVGGTSTSSRPAMPAVRAIPRINPTLEAAMYFC